MSGARVNVSIARRLPHPLLAAICVAIVVIGGITPISPDAAAAPSPRAARAAAVATWLLESGQASVPVATITAVAGGPWRGPDGHPLPFRSHAEVGEFLRAAEVVSMEEITEGSTRPQKVLLEKDGVRLHAIFRSFVRVQERTEDPRTGQFIMGDAKDSALFEAAAYELAMMLELPLVPPTVRRVINNSDGTLQLWIETATTETERRELGVEPPNASWWSGIMQTLRIWDMLIFNADRNTGNFLIDPDWGVWFVDHTRAFQRRRDLRTLESVTFCERLLWERLNTITDDEIKDRMAPYLDGREIGALLARRDRIVAHIEKLIEENGEDRVVFRYSYDLADWVQP